MTTKADSIYVHPPGLLRVTCAEPDGSTTEILALACHYVVCETPSTRRSIGIEVVFDPTIQPPHDLHEPYFCPASRVERRVLAPKDLKKIAPIHREGPSS